MALSERWRKAAQKGRVAVRLGSGKSLAVPWPCDEIMCHVPSPTRSMSVDNGAEVRPGNLRLAEVDAFDADLDADDSPVAPSEDAGLRARKTGATSLSGA